MNAFRLTDGKYIRITNEAQNVNRLFLEKLGLSTKRDDEVSIGQFGSGSKFAPICALRKGLEWINVGEDELGPYKMEYVVEKEQGIDCIFFRYNDEVMKPSSFTIDAGSLSWEDPFQIFREAFSNALDEFLTDDAKYNIEMVDDVVHEKGIFSVYITADQDLLDIINNFDDWFSINREPIFTYDGSSIFHSVKPTINIFFKGVNVHQSNLQDNPPIFDYQFNSIRLNEERRVFHHYEIGTKIAEMWKAIARIESDDESYDSAYQAASVIVERISRAKYETTKASKYDFDYCGWINVDDNPFKNAWNAIHGEKQIIALSSLSHFKSQAVVRGFKTPIFMNEPMHLFLSLCGITTLSSIMGDEVEFNFVELNEKESVNYQKALSIVTQYDNRILMYSDNIKFFEPDGEQENVRGCASIKEELIYLNKNIMGSAISIVKTLIHELDHVVTGLADSDYNEFRSCADDRIATLVMAKYGDFNA